MKFKIEMEMPEGVGESEAMEYLCSALVSYSGGLHPDDPFFILNQKSFDIRPLHYSAPSPHHKGDIYDKALKLWGEEAQIKVAIEEMAELINALMKFDRNRVCTNEVAEEIADCQIMLEQLSNIFCGAGVIEQIKLRKLQRLMDRIEASQYEPKGE